MGKSDILIAVKTYPEISKKYDETVCTAGILADTRKLIRLYPIRFRYLEGHRQFRKYQWIRANIHKALSDTRPESYHIETESIEMGALVPASKIWAERRDWLIHEHTLFPSVRALRDAQREKGTSLGIVKPARLKRVLIQSKDPKEIREAIAKKDSIVNQLDLFEEKKDLYILPVRIMIEFACHDPQCTGHSMSVLDWEFGQLYRKLVTGPEWQAKIVTKIRDDIFGPKRDTYLILGNMAAHPRTFCVLGFFWPPKSHDRQMPLFG